MIENEECDGGSTDGAEADNARIEKDRGQASFRVGRDALLKAYEKMSRIRAFEDRLHEENATGDIPGFIHLYSGQEAIAVGVCENLSDADYIGSTHRGHGHCIAKGCDLNGMMAEIFGKDDGLCRGKGGSMHIADLSVGMLGANAIVGARRRWRSVQH